MSPIPPFLKTGDTVGITCPAGYMCLPDIQPAVDALIRWGYQVRIGKTIDAQDNTFAGDDALRASDLQDLLDDDQVRAILFARGGYGTVRIIDRVNFNRFYLRPKWLIGYSDITVLHCHVQTQMHIPTVHAEMCIDLKYSTTDLSAITVQQALCGDPLSYSFPAHPLNRPGSSAGLLVGGNLSLVVSVTGSASELETYGKILFLEDVDEYLYNIDRMMYTLKRSGKLAHLSGLVVGGMTRTREDPNDVPFGHEPYDIILDTVREYDYPVCFGFPAGHEAENYALRLGLPYRLTVAAVSCGLAEISGIPGGTPG
ncbi:MAG TPA: LD-carboxypeptidase [Chitinophagaceae bacterium]|nr:LD-carboxypeptidase [Chitinophagaceae bacterium]